jgi:hypothetical protein
VLQPVALNSWLVLQNKIAKILLDEEFVVLADGEGLLVIVSKVQPVDCLLVDRKLVIFDQCCSLILVD